MKTYSESELSENVAYVLEEVDEEVIEVVREQGDSVILLPKAMFDLFITEGAEQFHRK